MVLNVEERRGLLCLAVRAAQVSLSSGSRIWRSRTLAQRKRGDQMLESGIAQITWINECIEQGTVECALVGAVVEEKMWMRNGDF